MLPSGACVLNLLIWKEKKQNVFRNNLKILIFSIHAAFFFLKDKRQNVFLAKFQDSMLS